MRHISFILPKGNSIVDTIIAPYNLFVMANSYQKRVSKSHNSLFKIDLVGTSLEPIVYQGLFSIQPTATLDSIDQTDLIIVSPISGNLKKEVEHNIEFVEWIKKQRIQYNTQLASLCKGTFLLAETGLLNGKSCTTHWTAHDEFNALYPKANLIPEKIICEENGIYTSGGAYSILNFTIYLIERFFGRETAIYISKVAEIDFDRISQSEFIVFSGQKNHSDNEIKKAQLFIEENFDKKISVDSIAAKVHLNTRSFLRRFKKATANTPIEYIQRVKIEAAKRLLESSTQAIFQVMYSVGYKDEKAFRNVFKKHTGLSPKEYQLKYNREMAVA